MAGGEHATREARICACLSETCATRRADIVPHVAGCRLRTLQHENGQHAAGHLAAGFRREVERRVVRHEDRQHHAGRRLLDSRRIREKPG
jgi:hypothetical protein